MSYVELQIKASTFLAMQRNALRNLAICPPVLPPVYGVQIVIDRVDIGNNALRHSIPEEFDMFRDQQGEVVGAAYNAKGFLPQLAQDITIYLTTQADILSKPNQSPTLVPFTVTLVFNLSLYSLTNECYIRAEVGAVELGPLPFLPSIFSPLGTLPPETLNDIKDFLTSQARLFLPTGTLPIGMENFALGSKFYNAGISVDSQMQTMAFRVQVGGGSNDNPSSSWTNFFSGYFTDKLQGSDFGFYLDANLLTEKFKYLIDSAIPDNDNLETFPGAAYSNANGVALFTLNVFIIYHLYRNSDLDLDITVDADPKVDIQLSIKTANHLTVDFDFSHLLDSDDPLVSLAMGFIKLLGIPIQKILMTLGGPLVIKELQGGPLDDCKITSDVHIECTKRIVVPQIPGSLQTTITNLLALENGIAIVGKINVQDLTPAIPSIGIQQFKIAVPSISCGQASLALVAAFQQDPSRFGILRAGAFISNADTAPLRLCNPPVVLRGGNGPFPQNRIRTDSIMAPISININLAAPAADYYADAYPLDLLIKTSGGTRLIRFNAPPKVTQQDYDRLTAGLLVAVGDCQQLVDPWARLHGGYNPRWSPRPPEEGFAVKHLWQVAVSGLPRGERVALVDKQNRHLVSVVSTGAPMRMMSVVEPGGEKELTIKNIGRVEGTVHHHVSRVEREILSDSQRPGIDVRQTLLLALGSIPLHEKCEKISISNLYGRQTVIAIHQDSLSFYDFSDAALPILVKTMQIEGVTGVLKWQDNLLVYGEQGLQNTEQTRRDAMWTDCKTGRIISATVDKTALYALTNERLHIYSKKFCKINELHLDGANSIIRVGNQLIAGGRNGLIRLKANEPYSCENERSFEDINVRLLLPTRIGEAGSFIAELEDGSAKVFQVNERSFFEEIAHCETLPWLSDTIRLDNYLVKTGEDCMQLEVYQYGETALVGAETREDTY